MDQPCSVLTITPDGLHHYAWAASMAVALEVMDPFSDCAYLRRRFIRDGKLSINHEAV